MEKDHSNYHPDEAAAAIFPMVEYSQLQHHQHQFGMIGGEASGESSNNNHNTNGMVNYMLNPPPHPSCSSEQQQQQQQGGGGGGFYGCSFDKLSFADVMQLADFGPKLGIHQTNITNNDDDKLQEEEEESGGGMMDPVLFLKFPVLNDKSLEEEDNEEDDNNVMMKSIMMENNNKESGGRDIENHVDLVEEEQVQGDDNEKNMNNNKSGGGKRKRPRSIKTSEEVESQRMTHIAVERNRRKQMNEHLRVLRSLMPGSYVQRGDQASIIGGAIEFVRELEQLLQCLESQKRRRVVGDSSSNNSNTNINNNDQGGGGGLFLPTIGDINQFDHNNATTTTTSNSIREETAENKSCVADVEVKVIGFDAMIKILSRRRPGQLIKTIAALEDLHLIILHTNITTIEQTVLYSFNVKVATDSRFTAQDIATSVQHIFSFIHDNTGI